ncbi:amidase [Bradyrhizobium elkanii]|uniref:Amidase n=1 Tax=Bradyrhizobium elkanii TaxID=29448 RepID=A0A4U6RAQ4_BRAEL|nr:amidase [Bradyrhizobium elkanii]TKV70899.1 amidase [Bradyrhizobium elkanii]
MPSRDIRDLYQTSDAIGLAKLIQRRDVTPSELMEAAIAQAEKINPCINALVSSDYELARSQARAYEANTTFAGVPYLEKNYAVQVAGFRTTNGSKFLHRLAPIAASDSEAVCRLRSAGLIPFGMTNSPEMGLDWATEPIVYGATLNPWNLAFSASGSSGGAAAAVAARIVPVAGGSDGGGSIRMPASFCGLVGLKPSRGRIPNPWQGVVVPGSVLGCLSRTVRDTAAYLDVTSGQCPGDYFTPPTRDGSFVELSAREPGRLRIGLAKSLPSGLKLDPEIADCLDETARLLENCGHRVEPCELSLFSESHRAARARIWAVQLAQRLIAAEEAFGTRMLDDDIEPYTRSLMEKGKSIDAVTFAGDIETARNSARDIAGQLARYDVVLSPVYPGHTFRRGEGCYKGDYTAWSEQKKLAFSEYLSPINESGVPAISLPVGEFGDGLPFGVQLVGRYGDEITLLQIANALEQQLRWHERQPAIVKEMSHGIAVTCGSAKFGLPLGSRK